MAVLLNDRQRVELSLPIHMMLTVLITGANNPQADEVVEARLLLLEAAIEPLSGLPPEHRLKLVRRIKRLHRDIMAPYSREETKAAQVGLAAFYMLQAIADSGFLIVGEDSKLAKALELMLPAIERQIDADIEAIAQKQARDCLMRLQSLGYYDDAAIICNFDDETLER